MPYRRRNAALVGAALGVVMLLACLSACGSGRSGNGTETASRAATLAERWHQVVLCARAHGMPNFPDPRLDAEGHAHFPPTITGISPETRRACQSLYDRLVPPTAATAPSAAAISSLLRFARCMRSQGVSNWPDPRPDGSFPLPPQLGPLVKTTLRAKVDACERFNPDPQGRLYASHP